MDVPGARDASDHLPLLSILDAPPVPLATTPVTSTTISTDELEAVELDP
jgi:hypothetical protein